ncbi:hypothetical protein LINPERHAP1_LOCUS11583 [Linum perenne]
MFTYYNFPILGSAAVLVSTIHFIPGCRFDIAAVLQFSLLPIGNHHLHPSDFPIGTTVKTTNNDIEVAQLNRTRCYCSLPVPVRTSRTSTDPDRDFLVVVSYSFRDKEEPVGISCLCTH